MELVYPFYIDDGELNNLTPQQCFVLGFECAVIVNDAENGGVGPWNVHTDNADRIKKIVEVCAGRPVQIRWHDDWSTIRI